MFAHRLRAHQRFDISWDNCETFLGVKIVSVVTGIMAEDEGFYHLSSATLDTSHQSCELLRHLAVEMILDLQKRLHCCIGLNRSRKKAAALIQNE